MKAPLLMVTTSTVLRARLLAAALGLSASASAPAVMAQPAAPGAVDETEDPWGDEEEIPKAGQAEKEAYEVRRPDPWGSEPPRKPLPPRGEGEYHHRDALEPWPATRGERRRLHRAASRPMPAAALPAPSASSNPAAGYDDGFFLRSLDDRFRLILNGRFQGRYTYEDVDTADGAEVHSAFSIPRARLSLKGNLFGSALTFRLQTAVDHGQAMLKDAYADYALVPGWLHVRGGQYKRPLSRQQINSSRTFQFVERSITSGRLGAARDMGLLIHDDYESSPPFEYSVGFFNGTGVSPRLVGPVIVDPITGEGEVVDGAFTNIPDRFQPELTARVAYNHGGIDGYTEVDFDGGPPRYSVGASVLVGFDGREPEDPALPGTGNVLGHLDTMLKAYGFTTTAGAFLLFVQDGSDFVDQGYSAAGFHVQAGYLLFDRAQPAVRYARVHQSLRGTIHEVGGALSLHFVDNHLVWQTDALVYLEDYAPDWRDHFVVRSQMQLMF